MSNHLRISSQINFRSFRPRPAGLGRFSKILSFKKYGNFCGVRSIRHKTIFAKYCIYNFVEMKNWLLNCKSHVWAVWIPTTLVPQYGVRPPSASMIARMILGCWSMIFRVASIGRVLHVSSSAFFHIIMVRSLFRFFDLGQWNPHENARYAHEKWRNSDLSWKWKEPWDRAENGYPRISHDCMPDETEFAETFQDAQGDLERREKNRNK